MDEVPKLIESAKAAPSATESALVMSIESNANPVKESESKKTAEQPKVLIPQGVTGLPKLSTSTIVIPRKRMTSILDAILEFMKPPTPIST
jgi:hypothetical protein